MITISCNFQECVCIIGDHHVLRNVKLEGSVKEKKGIRETVGEKPGIVGVKVINSDSMHV